MEQHGSRLLGRLRKIAYGVAVDLLGRSLVILRTVDIRIGRAVEYNVITPDLDACHHSPGIRYIQLRDIRKGIFVG